MHKQELPLMFPEDEDVQMVAEAMFDPFEYLVLRDKDGLLKKDFKHPLGNVSYHIPCHSRVQNTGQKTREVLEWIPTPRSTPWSAVPVTTARGGSSASTTPTR
jgi:Fe-S oxidoreductase